jgi:steroid delta-isomerase-like uncharacterized protein
MDLQHTTHQLFDALISRGDLSLVDALIAPDFVNDRGPGGREGFAAGLMAVRAAFPDWTSSVDELMVGDQTVAARWTVRGTQRGAFMGIPATGRSVVMQECGFLSFREGKLCAIRRVADELSMLRQLGVLPEGM